jgi:hypothetical protein
MDEPVAHIPAPRSPAGRAEPAARAIPLEEALAWHEPGVHRVRLAGREVWVRMDERGIASMSSVGPERLADNPMG